MTKAEVLAMYKRVTDRNRWAKSQADWRRGTVLARFLLSLPPSLTPPSLPMVHSPERRGLAIWISGNTEKKDIQESEHLAHLTPIADPVAWRASCRLLPTKEHRLKHLLY